jgi:hypothetical protein
VGADGAVIQLVTRCESADEFVERFARFTTETDLVVPALPNMSVGTTGRFVIRLKDQSAIMAGRCEVSEVLPMAATPNAPPRSARVLMRLRLMEMDASSFGIHLRLMARRASPVGTPSAPAPPRPPAVPALSIVRSPPAVPPPAAPPPRFDGPPALAPSAPAPPTHALAMVRAQPVENAPGPARNVVGTIGRTATVLAAAPAPLESETTEASPVPRPETRLPGAALTLPANPLSDLDASDLASFVEFTLLETEGVDPASVPSEIRQARAGVSLPLLAVLSDARFERARRIARRAWPYLTCVLGLLGGLSLRSSPKAPPVVVVAPKVASPSDAPAVPTPTEPVTVPAAAGETRNGARADCVARVTTRPAGAAVFWGDLALGPSPIEHAPIRCGSATVTVRHERYAEVTRTVTAEPGQSAVISERLSRPPAKLLVISSPPRALIKLNRHAFGPAPRRIGTLRFEHVRIEASLPGYQRWAKTLYLKDAETKVEVTLSPLPKPKARRAAASPVPPSRGTPPARAR